MLLSLCKQHRDKILHISILSADSEIYIIMDVTIYLPHKSTCIRTYLQTLCRFYNFKSCNLKKDKRTFILIWMHNIKRINAQDNQNKIKFHKSLLMFLAH